MALPARRLLNVVMRWAMERIPAEDREEWLRQMKEPLAYQKTETGRPVPTTADLQADRDAFLATMGQKGKM